MMKTMLAICLLTVPFVPVGASVDGPLTVPHAAAPGEDLAPAPPAPAPALPGLAPPAADVEGQPVDPQPMHGCIVVHLPIVCPTQCSDGVDNDGDGYRDTSDPGCAGDPNDDDEYNCWTSSRRVHAYLLTTGTGWGTKDEITATYEYGCPGGPFLGEHHAQSGCTAGPGWTVSDCRWTIHTSSTLEGQATFTCVSSVCAGKPSPHVVSVRLDMYNDGRYHCLGTVPLTASWTIHCEQH